MTLTEYRDQEKPRMMPKVVLQKGEYWQGNFVGIPGFKTAPVTINGYPYCYVVKEGYRCLYTQDEHGNPKTISCFNLPD